MRPIHLLVLGMLLMFATDISAAERLSVYTVNYHWHISPNVSVATRSRLFSRHQLMSIRLTGCPTKQQSLPTSRPT